MDPMSKYHEAALIILCAAVDNYQTHLRFREVATIAEQLAYVLRDAQVIEITPVPTLVSWANPEATWNGMLARDLLLVRPMLYRDVRGTDLTVAHRLWRAVCAANWVAIDPFPIAVELVDLSRAPREWKEAGTLWPYFYMNVRTILERAQPLG